MPDRGLKAWVEAKKLPADSCLPTLQVDGQGPGQIQQIATGAAVSDVESKFNHIAIHDLVILALDAELARIPGS